MITSRKKVIMNVWIAIGVFIILGLAAQVTVVKALEVNTASKRFTLANTLPNDQVLPMVNKSMLAVNVAAIPTYLSTVENDPAETVRNVLNLNNLANRTSLTTQILRQHYSVDVLRQFDRIDEAMLKVISIFRTPYISLGIEACGARSTDIFENRPTCTVSQDKLVELKNVIKVALSEIDQKPSDITCNFTALEQSNSDNSDCDITLQIINCGIYSLKEGIINSQANGILQEKYDALIALNAKLSEDLENVVDDLNVKFSQECEVMADKYKEEIANLTKVISGLRASIENFTMNLCVSEINSGRLIDAFNHFKILNNDSKLPKIITDSYNYLSDFDRNNSNNKLKNVQNILEFRLKFPSVNQTVVLQSLFKAMETNNHLDSPEILMVDRAIKITEENCCLDTAIKNELISLRNKLALRITNIIAGWATKVRLNTGHVEIRNFVLKYMSSDQFSQLVEKAYANNLGNVQTIINFIQGFDYIGIEQGFVGYSNLFEQMSKNAHIDTTEIIKLAYFIKQFMENNNMSNDKQFTNLKNKFPTAVRGLIWNGSCHIKNKYWNEYLYAANNDNAYDKDRRNVFTWRPGGKVLQGNWKFEPVDDATTFKIKNIEYSQYLYADGLKTYNKERRYAFAWRSALTASFEIYWRLEPINQATIFRIKNTMRQEYLYAAADNMAYNKERRRVFTWIPRDVVREGDWILEC